MKSDSKTHWDRVYSTFDVETLGWHEEDPEPSMRMIVKSGIGRDAAILDVGSGASTLVGRLVQEGFEHVSVVDISAVAIGKARTRLGDRARAVRWIVDDITRPRKPLDEGEVDLWHDRAVLHFLLSDAERAAYRETLMRLVRIGGYVVIAVFSLQGVTRCSGLDVRRYSEDTLSDFLGTSFELVDAFDQLYVTPSGENRPYVYSLFRRID